MKAVDLLRVLRGQGITDDRVLAAMANVPRDEFVPADQRRHAWENRPLPIGSGQTISQPFIVAYTTQALRLAAGSRVLDVGTGCGYQAAVLAECGFQVHGIEIRADLAQRARTTLGLLGYDVSVTTGDGRLGLPQHAPFDGIVVAAAATAVPAALVAQLRDPGGRMIMPLGGFTQRLVLVEPPAGRPLVTDLLGVLFVPLV